MDTKTISNLLLLLFISTMLIAKDNSVQTGNWETDDTWAKGVEPTTEDTLIISENDTVTISSNLSYGTEVLIIVYGALEMTTGKLNLVEGSELYLVDGNLISSGGGNSDKIKVNGVGVWDGNMGDYSGDFTFSETGITPSNPLPVTWGNIKGYTSDNNITLQWTTLSELNNDFFVIEYSKDLEEWEEIDIVESKYGNSHFETEYSSTLNIKPDGVVYVRINQYDYDGQYDTSKIITFDLGKPAVISHYLTLSGIVSYTKPKGVYIVVYDNGKKVKIIEK